MPTQNTMPATRTTDVLTFILPIVLLAAVASVTAGMVVSSFFVGAMTASIVINGSVLVHAIVTLLT